MKHSIYIIITVLIAVTLIWLIAYYEIIPGFLISDAEVLIASLGFAGLIINLYYQQIEIRQTKEDQTIQRFESGFFILFKEFLDAQNSIKHTGPLPKIINLDTLASSINFVSEQEPLGREIFIEFDNSIRLFRENDLSKHPNLQGALLTITNAYAKPTHVYRRRIETLFDYILKSGIKENQIREYIFMVINQLMISEVSFHYFHSIISPSDNSIVKILKKYPEILHFSSSPDHYLELIKAK